MHKTDLSAVRQPISLARGLPNAHYIDAAVFEEERGALLMSGWSGLAVAADVPDPGDARPLTFLGMPLLLIRDRGGQVRVFHNICRHRGMILVDAPRKIEGAIRCPYHSWCYSTEGRLVSTPHVGGPGQNTAEGIDRDLLGLVEVRSHIWLGVVWINLSGDAPDFEKANADLLARWSEFGKPLFHGGPDSAFQLEVKCNWKLAVENYCESYHLPWVHPGLNSYSRLEDHYHIEQPGQFSGQGTLVYRQLTGEDGATFPDFEGLPIPTYCWACIATTPSRLSSSRRAPAKRSNMCICSMPAPTPIRPCAPGTLPSGKKCSKKTSLSSRACSADATHPALTVGASRPRWMARPTCSTIGWPSIWRCTARPIKQRNERSGRAAAGRACQP